MTSGTLVIADSAEARQRRLRFGLADAVALPLGAQVLAMLCGERLDVALVMPPAVEVRFRVGARWSLPLAALVLLESDREYEVRVLAASDATAQSEHSYVLRFEPSPLSLTAAQCGRRSCPVCYDAMDENTLMRACVACGTWHCPLCSQSSQCLECSREFEPLTERVA